MLSCTLEERNTSPFGLAERPADFTPEFQEEQGRSELLQELSCGKGVLGSYPAAGEHCCQGWRFQVCVS